MSLFCFHFFPLLWNTCNFNLDPHPLSCTSLMFFLSILITECFLYFSNNSGLTCVLLLLEDDDTHRIVFCCENSSILFPCV